MLKLTLVNYNLQKHLIEALSGQELKISLPNILYPKAIEIEREEDGEFVVYQKHMRVPKQVDEMLKGLPNDQATDKKFVKILFETQFQNSDLRKMNYEGHNKHQIMTSIMLTKEYFIMRGN